MTVLLMWLLFFTSLPTWLLGLAMIMDTIIISIALATGHIAGVITL